MMNYDIESRIRSIATNAVRETRVSLNIDAGPWLVDHAKRLDLIFNTLKDLSLAPSEDQYAEPYPLSLKKEPEADPRLEKMASILDTIEAEIKNEPAFKIPKPKNEPASDK